MLKNKNKQNRFPDPRPSHFVMHTLPDWTVGFRGPFRDQLGVPNLKWAGEGRWERDRAVKTLPPPSSLPSSSTRWVSGLCEALGTRQREDGGGRCPGGSSSKEQETKQRAAGVTGL